MVSTDDSSDGETEVMKMPRGIAAGQALRSVGSRSSLGEDNDNDASHAQFAQTYWLCCVTTTGPTRRSPYPFDVTSPAKLKSLRKVRPRSQ